MADNLAMESMMIYGDDEREENKQPDEQTEEEKKIGSGPGEGTEDASE